MDPTIAALSKLALGHAGVTEGVACAGTAIESRTMKVSGKAFLFLRQSEARLKLSASIPEAEKLQEKDRGRYVVGTKGWIKITWPADGRPPMPVMKRWIAESYRSMAAK